MVSKSEPWQTGKEGDSSFSHLSGSVVIPSSCCMSFISKKIPESRVLSYQLSSGSICPKAGVM